MLDKNLIDKLVVGVCVACAIFAGGMEYGKQTASERLTMAALECKAQPGEKLVYSVQRQDGSIVCHWVASGTAYGKTLTKRVAG